MLPGAFHISLSFHLSKFLLSVVPGSHSELAANRLYYLRPFTQGGNEICIQVKHMFLGKSKKPNHEQSEGSQELCHHPQGFVKPIQVHLPFHKTDMSSCTLLARSLPSFSSDVLPWAFKSSGAYSSLPSPLYQVTKEEE